MRKSAWVIGVLSLLLTIAASPVLADTYTDYNINFGGPAGTLFPTSGTIVYDTTTGAANPFASFVVNWDGEVFNFTQAANLDAYGSSGLKYINIPTFAGCSGPTGEQTLITVLTTCTSDAVWAASADTTTNNVSFTIEYNSPTGGFPYFVDLLDPNTIPPPLESARPGYTGNGGGLPFTITDPVPEPGTSALLLVGAVTLFALRRRMTGLV